jgi:tRNA U34 2-thiouridine synthase MnmA/TrmU
VTALLAEESEHHVLFCASWYLRVNATNTHAARQTLKWRQCPSRRAVCCVAGRRKFGDFLSQYVAPVPGRLVDVGSGADLGACPNVLALTHGQRAGIGGAAGRCTLAVMLP